MEDQFPKESITAKTQASKPSVVFEDIRVVDPYRNIHGEPIVPKDEPIEWDKIPIPDFNLPILSKPKRTKSRAVKKVRAIDAYRNLPERLVFKYKRGREIQWPLHRILQESQAVLIKVYSSFKKNFGSM